MPGKVRSGDPSELRKPSLAELVDRALHTGQESHTARMRRLSFEYLALLRKELYASMCDAVADIESPSRRLRDAQDAHAASSWGTPDTLEVSVGVWPHIALQYSTPENPTAEQLEEQRCFITWSNTIITDFFVMLKSEGVERLATVHIHGADGPGISYIQWHFERRNLSPALSETLLKFAGPTGSREAPLRFRLVARLRGSPRPAPSSDPGP